MINYIDVELMINQAAHGVTPFADVGRWFEAQGPETKRKAIVMLSNMIVNAKYLPSDGPLAIELSGLKPTLTPCVLLSKGAHRNRLNQIEALSGDKVQRQAFELLLALLGVADRRRKADVCGHGCTRHWWHGDLGSPTYVEHVRQMHRTGLTM